MELVEISEVFDTVVSEITAGEGGMVPISPELRQQVIAGDDDPLFATYVIESGWSRSKRFWGPELFGKVASEISDAAVTEPIVGYMGHIRPDDDAYSFPEIQLQWVGAKLLSAGEKARLGVKAYILPGSQARNYANKNRNFIKSVSWRGKVAQEIFDKGVRIKEFAIESIDLARPRSAGMSARLVALSSEMEQEGGNSVKPEEIAALQENELRAHAPNLVKKIEDSAKEPLETKVSEMTDASTAVKPTLDLIPSLREILGLDDKADDLSVLQAAVTSIKEQGKKLRDTVLDSVLEKKFKGKDSTLLRRVIVGEITSKNLTLTGDETKDEQTVTEMVNTIINGDEKLKEIVSEMEGTPASPPGAPPPAPGTPDYKAGSETSTLRVRSLA